MDFARSSSEERFLIGVIADEETTIGFLMAGIGEASGRTYLDRNYLIVTERTPSSDVEKFFTTLYNRKHIGAILIGSEIYQQLLPIIHKNLKQLPILLEIPSKKSLAENVQVVHKEINK